ncbi:toll/interleukin-1 receptor domain-containing protein [Pyxidicoccus caerfyrddinensis]|uniref:toll/interleukin-1 receptor domain-containing protein n=1 Tax=Pyxidicoccus caerfyrddinensis TaxID=2709663 RepID=UPI0013DCC3B2|nr:toll/interleukin-1 receptor domain-containing protein [Pyxidicoccus caerfyrddinensis]
MSIFVSHIAEEAHVARNLKEQLERTIPGAKVFVSSGLTKGLPWLAAVEHALRKARVVLVLCSPRSVARSWVNFESGAGWSRKARVIPICHDGLRLEDLPLPLNMFQGVDLGSDNAHEDLDGLIRDMAESLRLPAAPRFDPRKMLQALVQQPAQHTAGIGIVLNHQQDQWDRTQCSPFEFPDSLPPKLRGRWPIKPLRRHADLLSARLHELSGLILGAPWRSQMDPRTITALVRWVHGGGRLLMLGYELGDRHHGGNLGELAVHFGIHLETDIVGPQNTDATKPYGARVDFAPGRAERHFLTEDLKKLWLANVQTLRVDPGGTEWLRVGNNIVCRPKHDSVKYEQGTLTQPGGQSFDLNRNAGWLPVGVEAPAGLCGRGCVLALGTWEIVGKHGAFWKHADNRELLFRLLDWLSRAGERTGHRQSRSHRSLGGRRS